MGLGMILAGLSGAGNALAHSAEEDQKAQVAEEAAKNADTRRFHTESSLEEVRSKLAGDRELRIAEAKHAMEIAPLGRYTKVAEKYANTMVPVTAADDPNAANFKAQYKDIGATDSPEAAYSAAKSSTPLGFDPSKLSDGELATLKEQFPDEYSAAMSAFADRSAPVSSKPLYQDSIPSDVDMGEFGNLKPAPVGIPTVNDMTPAQSGQTRKMTSREVMKATLDELRNTDVEAYLAAHKAFSNTTREQGPDGQSIDSATNEVLQKNEAGEKNRAARLAGINAQIEGKKEIAGMNNETKKYMSELRANLVASNAKSTPEDIKSAAEAIAALQMAPANVNKPNGLAIMAEVRRMNPNYDATDWSTKSDADKKFAGGPQGNSVRSINVALDHIETLSRLGDALKNNDTQLINKLYNSLAIGAGAVPPATFAAAKHMVADEIVKGVLGNGAGALADRAEAVKTLDAENNPEQLKGIFSTYKEMMASQMSHLSDQYRATTRKNDFETRYMSPAARALIGNVMASSPTPSATPPTKPVTINNPLLQTKRPSLDDIFGKPQ